MIIKKDVIQRGMQWSEGSILDGIPFPGQDAITRKKHFAGKYNAYYLIYWERFEYIEHAIEREKEIKGWSPAKKEGLIADFNPEWQFLNDTVD